MATSSTIFSCGFVSFGHGATGAQKTMVMGVGATRRLNAVRSGVAWRIVWAWILAVPVSTALAALATLLVIAGPPLAIVLAIFVLGTAALALLVQRTRSKQLTGDFASRR